MCNIGITVELDMALIEFDHQGRNLSIYRYFTTSCMIILQEVSNKEAYEELAQFVS